MDKDKKEAEYGFKAEVYEEDLTYRHLPVDLSQADAEAKQVAADDVQLSAGQTTNNMVRTAPTPLIDDYYMSSQYIMSLNGETVARFLLKLGKADFHKRSVCCIDQCR